MVFGCGGAKHREVKAAELAQLVRDGAALVVDVREADEFAEGHIPGSLNMPLSTFQPSQLPNPGERQLVLTCLGGKRSGIALDRCRAIEAAADTHLAGGFGAWKAAGLAIER